MTSAVRVSGVVGKFGADVVSDAETLVKTLSEDE